MRWSGTMQATPWHFWAIANVLATCWITDASLHLRYIHKCTCTGTSTINFNSMRKMAFFLLNHFYVYLATFILNLYWFTAINIWWSYSSIWSNLISVLKHTGQYLILIHWRIVKDPEYTTRVHFSSWGIPCFGTQLYHSIKKQCKIWASIKL